MNIAYVWLIGAVLVAGLRNRTSRVVWVTIVVACAAVSMAIAVRGPAPPGPQLAIGSLSAALLAIVMTVVASEKVEGVAVAVLMVTVSLVSIAFQSENPQAEALPLFAAACVLAVRWMAVAAGRQTVAAVRAVMAGGALLVAVPPFLPLTETATGPWPVLVCGLVLCSMVGLLGLFPMGGWVSVLLSHIEPVDAVAWIFLMVPAALLVEFRVMVSLPDQIEVILQNTFLTVALVSAVWSAGHALRLAGRDRYIRVLQADIALGVASLMAGSWSAALGLQLLLVMHLVAFPVMSGSRPAARGWWLGLSSLPPAPGFWVRLALCIGCAGNSWQSLSVAVVAVIAINLGCVIEAFSPGDQATELQDLAVRRRRLVAVLGTAIFVWLTVAPMQLAHAAFGLIGQ